MEQRIIEQAARLSPGQAVTGWAALRLWGAGLFDGVAADGRTALPVPIAVGSAGGLRQGRGALVLHDRLPAGDLVDVAGVPVTSVHRATFDAVRLTRDLWRAVAVLDTALGAALLTRDDFADWAGTRSGWNGITLVRAALPLSREWVRSPQETRLRLMVELGVGLGGLLVNHTVVGTATPGPGEVDLFDEEAGMVLEFDGADHRSPAQHRHDLAKEDAATDLSLVLARFTSADLRRPELVRHRVVSTRSRAAFLSEDERPWVVRPPGTRHNRVLGARLRAIR